jgi:hypothetical protein
MTSHFLDRDRIEEQSTGEWPNPYDEQEQVWAEEADDLLDAAELERNLFSHLYGGSPLSRPRPKVKDDDGG